MEESEFVLIIRSTKKVVLSAINKYIFQEFYYSIDDIVQETYLRAYKSLSKNKFRDESKLHSWLFAIARNETLRMNKKLSKLRKLEQKQIEKIKDNSNILTEIKPDSYQKEVLQDMLLKLESKDKNIMELYLQGYKEKEISQMLKIKTGTVRSRIHRAKQKIKKKLGVNNG